MVVKIHKAIVYCEQKRFLACGFSFFFGPAILAGRFMLVLYWSIRYLSQLLKLLHIMMGVCLIGLNCE